MASRIRVKILSRLPKPVKSGIKRLRYWFWEAIYARRRRRLEFDLQRVLMVDPRSIDDYLVFEKGEWDKTQDKGSVRGGDWDLKTEPFESLDVYQAMEGRFVRDQPWEDSEFYQRLLAGINAGEAKWGCMSREDLDGRMMFFEELYEDMKANGFRSHVDRNETHGQHDEVSVFVNRKGRLLFHDGRHRLSIARLAGIEEIPVQITCCHQDWYEFCKEILLERDNRSGQLYAPVTHPMLSHIPSAHGHKRFDLMKENLPVEGGSLLDIGAHWGYFCHRFEDLGFDCTAIEIGERYANIIRRLRDGEGKKFDVFNGSIFDFDKHQFDVVLALYIFHHFIKEQSVFEVFVDFLKKLEVQAMFFASHDPNEPQMEGAYKNFPPEEFADFLMEHTGLTQKKLIGSFDNNRQLFVLSK